MRNLIPANSRRIGEFKFVERIGDEAGGVLHPGMIRSEGFVIGRKRGLAKLQSFSRLTEGEQ